MAQAYFKLQIAIDIIRAALEKCEGEENGRAVVLALRFILKKIKDVRYVNRVFLRSDRISPLITCRTACRTLVYMIRRAAVEELRAFHVRVRRAM